MFQVLNDEELELLNNNRYEVIYKAGEMMVKQGASITNLIYMTSGLSKMYVEGYTGKNMIIRIYKSWDLVGGWEIYYDTRHHYSVAAIEDTTACFIDIQVFKSLIKSNSRFAEVFIKELSTRGNYCMERLVGITQKQMHGRMADALLYLCNYVFDSNPFPLSLSRQDMGDMTGMSKDSAIRVLKELETEGIIEQNGKNLEIKRMETLREISLKG